MSLSYRASGKLGDLLQTFKAEFLTKLTQEDLEMQVTLSVRESFDKAAKNDEWLKEKLVEVIDDD